jgi:hypothetical protein
MKLSLAVCAFFLLPFGAASAQCNAFIPLRDDAQQKAAAVRAATERKAERKEVCALVTRFAGTEAAVVKFLEDNETRCGIPDEAVKAAKAGHERTLNFRTMACTEVPAAQPHEPTLGGAIGTRSVDAAGNTNSIGPPISVSMQIENGTYVVPVLINNAITLNFVVDSGAADVSIPADVVMTLMRTGTLKKTDFLGEKTYFLADGSKVPSQTFRIRSLKVGNRVIENVNGSVASVKGDLLLGQSFLGRFKSWSVDNTKHALLLSE